MKTFFYTGVWLAAGMLASCSQKIVEGEAFLSGNLPSKYEVVENVAGVKGVSLVKLDDYNFEMNVEQLEKLANQNSSSPAACSEVRKGDFVTRNMDFYWWDQASYVVSIAHTDTHNASLFVGGGNDLVNHSTSIKDFDENLMNILAGTCNDGINEHGVYIGLNVVPFGEMTEADSEKLELLDYKAPEGSVNANKHKLPIACLARLILDQANSLDHAKELITGTSWYDLAAVKESGFQYHWFVATKEGSFVCEFIDNKPVFVDAKDTNTPDLGNIMTNFSNYLYQKSEKIQAHGNGYERFADLASIYDGEASVEKGKDFARKVFYSQMYRKSYDSPNYWWSDWAGAGEVDFRNQDVMAFADPAKRQGKVWDALKEKYDFGSKNWDWTKQGYDKDRKYNLWFTSHSSVWNLVDKTLVLDVEEQNAFRICVGLDGSLRNEE